jgi:hypothetical protein
MGIAKKEFLVDPVRKIGRALSDGYYGASYIPDQSGQFQQILIVIFKPNAP